jgi:hypothetical protein
MPTKFQALNINRYEVMLPDPKRFYEGRKFNLVATHQSLKILFLSQMLSKTSLP